ncbi:MAG: HsdR family type I site-specific deoxyribonuclease, partial [Myxococcota bacterium]
MSSGPEFEKVENPFIDQLVSMGWKHTTGNLDHPDVSGRTNFREVILEQDLRRMIQKINVDDEGNPWLDDSRISTAISALTRLQSNSLLEANEKATDLLMVGASVEGGLEIFGGREPTAYFIDWDNPENNEYRVINQFRVDEPGSHTKDYIIPDLVLFINGIPIGVVECKKPGVNHNHSKTQGIPEAINQLRRYSNQRHHIEGDEGNEELFHTNQLLIATCYNYACVGTITSVSSYKYFLEWKDTSPVPMSEVAESINKTQLSSQEKLVSGMLHPAHLLDIIRHFTLFMESEGRKIKIVCRYQQFRAVHASINRLKNGKTILEDTEKPPRDERGGIIWHTQGSGKSLTMVFLVRKMRSTTKLQGFKIIVVTDRTSLQEQLSKTLDLSGDVVQIARNTCDLKSKLSDKTPNVSFAMIQKYRQQSADDDDQETEDTGSSIGQEIEEFPELNDSTKVLILVDEAHRSHGIDAKSLTQGLSEGSKNSKSLPLHMNLRLALPNAAMIGFTGTPIIMRAKKKTKDIFGEYIDTYTIRESEEDGATVPILYEGRTSEGSVEDGQDLDRVFEDFFKDMTSDELEALKQKYTTKGKVQEAEELIAAKAKDMLYHYIGNIMPNGFKAQVVAYSRRATVRFHNAFLKARDELVEKLESLPATIQELKAQIETLQPPSDGSGSDDHLKALQAYQQKHTSLRAELEFLPKALLHLAQIRALAFAPIISDGKVGSDDPPPSWAQWTKKSNIRNDIRRFKRKLGPVEDKTQSPLAFLIVKSMLLTGFDAPIEQVMYLDRPIKEAELLQAIARVNRTGPDKKKVGIVVDYYGVANHLKKALEAYDANDVDGAMRKLKDELPKLRDASLLARKIFTDR